MSSPISYLPAALLSLFFFFFFNFHGSNANFSPSTNCPIYNCKNGPKFHYPFWKVEDSSAAADDQYCGYRGFGLNCSSESGEPILTLPNTDSFYVKGINFDEYTITLVDIGVVDQSCPSARHSISVGTLPFDYSPSDANLSFYFNCTASNPDDPYPSATPIPCLESHDSNGGITNQSFLFMEGEDTKEFDWSEKCAEKVVVTVMKKSIADIIINGRFIDGFKNGFVLNWNIATECGSCEAGGGRCGYNPRVTTTNPEFLCFCKDGSTRNGLCKKEEKFNWRIKVVVGVCSAIGNISIMCIIFLLWQRRNRIRYGPSSYASEAFIQNIGPLAVKRYKFSDVRKMTSSFKDKLGQGGYGDAYKGKLLNGCRVAVKVLKASKGNGEDFVNEVASISRTSHVNVVTLLGYCFEGKESIISMLDARGTIGYIAPEVFCRNFGGVSAKSDVYSYGMMILEMVGGRKNVDAQVSHTSEIYFPDWVYGHLEQGSNFGLLNAVTEEEKEIARKMILVGLWCIQTKPSVRPSMSQVIDMLEGSIEALQIPPKPILSSPVRSPPPESTTLSTLS